MRRGPNNYNRVPLTEEVFPMVLTEEDPMTLKEQGPMTLTEEDPIVLAEEDPVTLTKEALVQSPFKDRMVYYVRSHDRAFSIPDELYSLMPKKTTKSSLKLH